MKFIDRISEILQKVDKDLDQDQSVFISADLLEHRHHPPFPADMPVMIIDVHSVTQLHSLVDLLLRIYPAEAPVSVFQEANRERKMNFTLNNIASQTELTFPLSIFMSSTQQGNAYESFEEIVAHLRAPDGCPWDKEQTHASLRPHLLEETYEVLDAMDKNDPESLKEELGDLLLQIVLNAQIATEEHEFRMADVVNGIYSKILRRHPHVFGDADIKEVDSILRNWEKLKENERKENGTAEVKGLLDGVPLALPALVQAQEYQDRAARVGFDWKTIEPVISKMHEEFEEVKTAVNDSERVKELGDLLFAVVNVIRWHKVDAESALRSASQRFVARFKYIESTAKKDKKNISELSFEEMDALWNEAKSKKIGS